MTGSNEIQKLTWEEEIERLWINDEQYIEGISAVAWGFRIGAYNVIEKWLKDRRGAKLTTQHTEWIGRIAAACKRTVEIAREIDSVITDFGGWPFVESTVLNEEVPGAEETDGGFEFPKKKIRVVHNMAPKAQSDAKAASKGRAKKKEAKKKEAKKKEAKKKEAKKKVVKKKRRSA